MEITQDKLKEGVRIGNDKLISVTKSAGIKLADLISKEADGAFLRIKIVGGGCNGLSYKMHFSEETKAGDILISTFKNWLMIDSKTALFIKGTSLDYSHDLVGGGFKFNNPNAKSSCSCGESFSL